MSKEIQIADRGVDTRVLLCVRHFTGDLQNIWDNIVIPFSDDRAEAQISNCPWLNS